MSSQPPECTTNYPVPFICPETIRVSVWKLRPVWVQAFGFFDNRRTQFPDRHQLGIYAHRMRDFHSGNSVRFAWQSPPPVGIVILISGVREPLFLVHKLGPRDAGHRAQKSPVARAVVCYLPNPALPAVSLLPSFEPKPPESRSPDPPPRPP